MRGVVRWKVAMEDGATSSYEAKSSGIEHVFPVLLEDESLATAMMMQ